MHEFSIKENESACNADAAEAKWRDMPDVKHVSTASTSTMVEPRAAITEALDLLLAEQRHILGECAKNYNQTTRVSSEGIQPFKNLIHNEGKLNLEVDYWAVVDGILPDKSLTGKPGEDGNHFLYGGVYIPSEDYVAEVERT
ncbi:hypothetical protein O181_086478 [Austropuccinia psidii MF-1]|uniref:Uncharacterized protein n=1 Tax=Austropuccinia psidii MF-1 TaxID=1389203 RepID=A0A9Q3FZC5_9BASI|nr:hypothetical protein [Austropuccinia psidii MF-1]